MSKSRLIFIPTMQSILYVRASNQLIETKCLGGLLIGDSGSRHCLRTCVHTRELYFLNFECFSIITISV